MKGQVVHKDCSKKCDDLSNELQLAKCQLEKLKISCGRSLCNPGADSDSINLNLLYQSLVRLLKFTIIKMQFATFYYHSKM